MFLYIDLFCPNQSWIECSAIYCLFHHFINCGFLVHICSENINVHEQMYICNEMARIEMKRNEMKFTLREFIDEMNYTHKKTVFSNQSKQKASSFFSIYVDELRAANVCVFLCLHVCCVIDVLLSFSFSSIFVLCIIIFFINSFFCPFLHSFSIENQYIYICVVVIECTQQNEKKTHELNIHING